MSLVVSTYADRAELWDGIGQAFEGVLPEYNRHGNAGRRYWRRLFDDYPHLQFVLVDDAGSSVVAQGRAIPYCLEAAPSEGGPGVDGVMEACFGGGGAPARSGVLCALGIEVAPAHRGRGYGRAVLSELRTLACSAGFATLVLPARPVCKHRYPLTPIERYANWTAPDGSPFDPWIRTLVALGGVAGAAVERSSLIEGTVAEWEAWTAMAFPDGGDYVFPDGLATLHVDRDHDVGTYWEPAVWVTYDVECGARSSSGVPHGAGD